MPLKLYLILLCWFPIIVTAQNRQGDQDLAIGYGMLTSEQIFDGTHIGILEPTLKQYSNNSASGMFFLNYKYFVNRRVTIGLNAGFEKESGDWLYDNMSGHSDDWSSSKIGVFSRSAFTIAPEFSIAYINKDFVSIYTTFGFGVTFKQETDVYQQAPQSNYGSYNSTLIPGMQVPDNVTKFNAYYSPFGISFGHSFGGFMEIGIGYKGLISAGLHYSFRSHRTSKDGPIIVLPYDYPVDKSLRRIGSISSYNSGYLGDSAFDKQMFDKQMNSLLKEAKDIGGNAVCLTYLRTHKLMGAYDNDSYDDTLSLQDQERRFGCKIKGEVYRSKHSDSLKAEVAVLKKDVLNNDSCAYLIIYVPKDVAYEAKISINDTNTFVFNRNAIYLFTLKEEGKYKISTHRNGALYIDIKRGNNYYVRATSKGNKTFIEQVDNLFGELESSYVKDRIYMDIDKDH